MTVVAAPEQVKIWAHSADSHFLEPEDLWSSILPPAQAARMPRSERVSDSEEIVHVDGQTFRRQLPRFMTKVGAGQLTAWDEGHRAPGARDVRLRLIDLDVEGIWGEVIYPSLGMWSHLVRDRELACAAARGQNEWLVSEIQGAAPDRLVPCAHIPLLAIEDAAAAAAHAAEIGLHAISLPTGTPSSVPDYNSDEWDRLWAVAEEANLVIGFHIGTDGGDTVRTRGPGGAIVNYVDTTYGGQRVATKLVASGALDRHPGLKILISEGGASWVPALGDRMNEAYRQHRGFVRPELSALPKEILYRQVYASFQHDESAPAACWAMGYRNVTWGADYPHVEGTFGHTQETLHELLDDIDEAVARRITRGAFEELFPHVSQPPC